MQTPTNGGQADYHSLFAYDYGLTYAEPKELALLNKDTSLNKPPVAETREIFNCRPVSPWHWVYRDNVNNEVVLTTSEAEGAT